MKFELKNRLICNKNKINLMKSSSKECLESCAIKEKYPADKTNHMVVLLLINYSLHNRALNQVSSAVEPKCVCVHSNVPFACFDA